MINRPSDASLLEHARQCWRDSAKKVEGQREGVLTIHELYRYGQCVLDSERGFAAHEDRKP